MGLTVPKRTNASRLRDLLLYVVIGLVCVGAVWLLAAYDKATDAIVLNWVGLGAVIAIVYITAIHQGRALRRKPRFWYGLGFALLAEVGVGTLVLWNAPRLSVLVWGLLYPINAAAVEAFLKWWLGGDTARWEVRRGPTRS